MKYILVLECRCAPSRFIVLEYISSDSILLYSRTEDVLILLNMRVDGSTYQSPKYLCDPLVVVIASLRKCVCLLASGLQLWHAFVYRSPPHRCTYVHLHPSVKKERGPF